MHVQFAFFADAAKVNRQGSFDILGAGVDAIAAKSLPVWLANLSVIARVVLVPDEINTPYQYALDCIQPDQSLRQSPLLIDGRLPPQARVADRGNWATLLFDMPGTLFSIPGTYNFRLRVEEKILCTLPFEVYVADDAP